MFLIKTSESNEWLKSDAFSCCLQTSNSTWWAKQWTLW